MSGLPARRVPRRTTVRLRRAAVGALAPGPRLSPQEARGAVAHERLTCSPRASTIPKSKGRLAPTLLQSLPSCPWDRRSRTPTWRRWEWMSLASGFPMTIAGPAQHEREDSRSTNIGDSQKLLPHEADRGTTFQATDLDPAGQAPHRAAGADSCWCTERTSDDARPWRGALGRP